MPDLFLKLLATFRSRAFYAEALRGRAGGFAWLMVVVALATVLFTIPVHWVTVTRGPAQAETFIAQLPLLTFEDGRLSTEPAGEQRIEAEGVVVVLIDDSIEGIPTDLRGARVMLARDYFVSVQTSGQVRAQRYDFIGDRTVTHDDWRRWWGWWMAWGWSVLGLVFFIYFAIGWALFALCAAVGGLLLRLVFKVEVGFGGLYRAATLALVPVIAIDLALDAASLQGAFGFWPRLLVALGLVAFGLKGLKEPPAAPSVTAA